MPFTTQRTHATAPLQVLIIGGGIAGIVLALLLERQGISVTLAERNKEWKPAGGGITLTLNGVAALRSIGLLPAVHPMANHINTINITTQQGGILSSFDLTGYNTTYAPTLTIYRTHLHRTLADHLKETIVHTGVTTEQIKQVNNKVQVTLSNGHSAHYDLVVGADGIHSSVRQFLFPQARSHYAGYASWRFVVQQPAYAHTTALTEMWASGKRFGIVPLPDGQVHCFASMNTKAHAIENTNIALPAFKELFANFGGAAPELLNALQNQHDLMYNDLEDIRLPHWYKGNIVLIGDAAHGMTPNMTQGASLAIEDAIVLAAQLRNTVDVETALQRFQSLRMPRVNAIQRKSALFGRIGQLQHPALCALRNFCWRRIPDKWLQHDLEQLLVNGIHHPEEKTTYSLAVTTHAVYHT